MVDESFAGLASIEVDLIWGSEGEWLVMDQGLKREGKGEAQVIFQLEVVRPNLRSGLDVRVDDHL